MNRDEVEKFLRIIKSFYPYFSITDDVFENWSNVLSNYNYNEVLEQFDVYFKSGDKEPPTCSILVYPLQTFKQKENSNINGIHVCSLCGKKFKTMEEADNCYEKDSSLKYICKMSDKLSIDPTEIFGDLKTVSLETINQNYSSFIKRIVLEEKQKNILSEKEKEGINLYWKHVIANKC